MNIKIKKPFKCKIGLHTWMYFHVVETGWELRQCMRCSNIQESEWEINTPLAHWHSLNLNKLLDLRGKTIEHRFKFNLNKAFLNNKQYISDELLKQVCEDINYNKLDSSTFEAYKD